MSSSNWLDAAPRIAKLLCISEQAVRDVFSRLKSPPKFLRLSSNQIQTIGQMYSAGCSREKIARKIDTTQHIVRTVIDLIKNELAYSIGIPDPVQEADAEVTEENVRLQKKLIQNMDRNRIERKSFREYARVENCLEALGTEIVSLLRSQPLHNLYKYPPVKYSPAIGIVHFTDHHYNELIEIPGNTYDFNIASQRLRLYIDRAKQYFRSCGVGKVLVAMTGDMLNSDRRMDEILNMATNRAKALVLAEELLRHALLDLRKEFELTVAYVVGNESRIDKDMSWTPKTLTNNFDTMLFHWLESRLQDIQGIDFIHGPEVELVVSIDNYNVLLTHGIKLDPKNIDKSIGLIRSRYASKNQPIHYVLCGHIHSASISDLYGRGASLAGSNAYNEYGLNIEGRASQNAYILNKDGHVDGIKIDLQDTTGISGYPINTKLAAYSPQSAQQLQPNTTVIRIVV